MGFQRRPSILNSAQVHFLSSCFQLFLCPIWFVKSSTGSQRSAIGLSVLSSNREGSSLGKRSVSQKKKGRAQRKEIKRGRINSNEDQRGEQESVRGINEFHPGATSVKWQLLSAASAADWQHKICQWQAATGGHVSVCLCVQAGLGFSVQIPSGSVRMEAFQQKGGENTQRKNQNWCRPVH